MWGRKKTVRETDVHEALEIREDARKDLAELKAQSPYVSRLSARLIERRALNHFGDDIQITFRPRGA